MNCRALKFVDLGITNIFHTSEVKLKIVKPLRRCILALKKIHNLKNYFAKTIGTKSVKFYTEI
jgi:uncharacterized protein YcbX